MTPSRQSLQTLIERCGLSLSAAQYDRLWAYHRMLRAANAELNLTRIHNFENMVLKHYVDSLLVLKFVELPSPLIDMGSGPGLPGIPLKIARPEVAMILAEPRGARAEFLREVCERLEAGGRRGLRRQGRAAVRPEGRRGHHPRRRVDPRDARPGGQLPRPGRPDALHEGARLRRRDRRGRAARTPGSSASSPTTPTRSPARRTTAGWSSTSGSKAPADDGPGGRRPTPGRSARSRARRTRRSSSAATCSAGRGIRKHGRAILAGSRTVAEVLARFPDRVEAWLTARQGPPPPADRPGLDWLRLADPLFQEVDVSGTHAPLLLVRVPEMPEWSDEAPWPDGLHAVRAVPGPGERRRGDPLGGGVRRVAGRAAPRGGAPVPPQGAPAPPARRCSRCRWSRGPRSATWPRGTPRSIALATDGPELGSEPRSPSGSAWSPGSKGRACPPTSARPSGGGSRSPRASSRSTPRPPSPSPSTPGAPGRCRRGSIRGPLDSGRPRR